ncbi:MAG: MBOAT family O-acyltransferase [Candidatus Limivivens sp.]|nr:MBOAT family O-acyltransferase [Candidatus Limivivens sp.]
MTVNSLPFLIFLTVLTLVYYAVRQKDQWICLLAGSLFFCFLAGNGLLGYLLLTCASTCGAVRWMEKLDEEQKKKHALQSNGQKPEDRKREAAVLKKKKKRILVLLMIFNFGILILVKYSDFLVGNLNRMLGILGGTGLPCPDFLVPLGISYYTLQSMGYALDVYKGKVSPEKSFWKNLLFLCFFPQITQGPIGRFEDLAPQLYYGHRFFYENLAMGCRRILWGLFKKFVIADRMKPMVDTIFGHYSRYSGMTLLLGCIYMSIQMYADFSGYMDIVAGAAEILGIRLAENFRRPFFSKSLAEYWRRWHITLSGWFRDYLFYPLSISKRAVKFGKLGKKLFGIRIGRLFPAAYAMVVVWFCTGLWHDSSWRYILWGVANGVIIIGAMCLEPWFGKMKAALHIREQSRLWQVFCMLRTFLIVSLLKVFPGAGSTRRSLAVLKRIFTKFRPELSYDAFFPGMEREHLFFVTVGLVLFFAVSLLQEQGPVRERPAKRPAALRWGCYLFLIGGILCMGAFEISMVGGFAYAQY